MPFVHLAFAQTTGVKLSILHLNDPDSKHLHVAHIAYMACLMLHVVIEYIATDCQPYVQHYKCHRFLQIRQHYTVRMYLALFRWLLLVTVLQYNWRSCTARAVVINSKSF